METLTVLHVEDDEVDRELVERAIAGDAAIRLIAAGSLARAREILRSRRVDVILLDHRLPDGNGTELLDGSFDLATILLTGHCDARSAVQALRKGAQDYLSKEDVSGCEAVLPQAVRRCHEHHRSGKELRIREEEMRDFARIASHELREPLRTLCLHTEILERRLGGIDPPDLADELRTIRGRARRAMVLVEDLRRYAETSTRDQQIAELSLAEVVDDVLKDLEALRREARAVVEVGTLPTVRGDRCHLRQVFQNLIGNALKFRRPEVQAVVEVHATAETSKHCTVAVQDNGIGFDDKYRDAILKPFRRLHRSDEYPGTGMGLAIAHRIIERHGGCLAISASPGRGARFEVTLPAAVSSPAETEPEGAGTTEARRLAPSPGPGPDRRPQVGLAARS